MSDFDWIEIENRNEQKKQEKRRNRLKLET